MVLTESQSSVITSLKNGILGSKNFCVSGNTGCGKTYLLSDLHSFIFNKNNFKSTIFFDQNDFKKLTARFMDNLPYKVLYTKELKENFITSVIRMLLSFLSKDYSRYIDIQKKYGEKQAKIVYFFMKYIEQNKKTKHILIIDNLNDWQPEYIIALDIILNNKDFNTHFSSSLNNTNIILSYTNNYHISHELNNLVKMLQSSETSENININSLSIDKLKKYMKICGVNNELIEQYYKTIYNISLGGNLLLINTACNYLQDNKAFSKDSDSIKNDVANILNLLLKNEPDIERILTSATLFEEQFTKSDLINLVKQIHDLESPITEKNITFSIEKNILKTEVTYLKFVDNMFSKYLKEKNIKEDNVIYYKAFAEFLTNVFPSQYYKRYKYNSLANNIEESKTLYILYIIQEYRYGNFNINIHDTFKDEQVIKTFLLFYKKFYSQHESLLLEDLYKLDSYGLDKRILFERNYLISLITLEIADQDSFNELYKNNLKWLNDLENEKEMIIRTKHIIFMIDMYRKEDILFSNCLEELKDLIYITSKVDISLEYFIHSLKRRTRMFNEPEIAFLDSKGSVEFFEKHKNKNLLFQREYFFSMVNYSDNLFQMNDLETAFIVARKAFDFLNSNSKFLPRITLLNNYCIFSLLKNKQYNSELMDECLSFIDKIDLYHENRSTYIMLLSNISSIYAYSGEYNHADKYLKKAFQVLSNQNDSFSRYSYHMKLNKMIIDYFTNNLIPDFDSLSIGNNDKYFKSDPLLTKQLNYYKDAFENVEKFGCLWDVDNYLKQYHSGYENAKNRWNCINKSLKFFTMQYWSK